MDLLYFVKYIHIYLELVLVRVDTDVLRPSDLQFEIIIFMLHGILIFYNLYQDRLGDIIKKVVSVSHGHILQMTATCTKNESIVVGWPIQDNQRTRDCWELYEAGHIVIN